MIRTKKLRSGYIKTINQYETDRQFNKNDKHLKKEPVPMANKHMIRYSTS